MFQTDDTIAAVSSAGGVAAIGIIRVSGPNALALIRPYLTALPVDQALTVCPAWQRVSGEFRLTDTIRCRCEVYFFNAPHSYTTQDLVEIHLPGSPALLQFVLQALLRDGARMANPGEFTCRAFLNNRIDLTEAQAVAAMIGAQCDSQLKAAERLLEGELRTRCREIKEPLKQLLALIEAGIDFSQEEIEFIDSCQVRQQLIAIIDQMNRLLSSSQSWQQLDLAPRVVLAGPPNAGKSSLANRLTGLERGIVSLVAGTTRDVLTSPLKLAHGECLLLDTAGLGPVDDPLGEASQHAARKAMQTANLIIWVMDATCPQAFEEIIQHQALIDVPAILVVNKIDLINGSVQLICQDTPFEKMLYCSALQNSHLEELRHTIDRMLADRLITAGRDEDIALTSMQQFELEAACQSMQNAVSLAEDAEPEQELIALEIRDALDHLAVIGGEVTTDDILGEIFGQFCIGK